MSGFPWLTVLGLVPLAGAVLVMVLPARREAAAKPVALGVALVTLVLALATAAAFDPHGDQFQFRQSYAWIPQFGVRYSVGADGIALTLIALTAVLTPVVVLASWQEAEQGSHSVRVFFALLLVLETMLIGVFAATDVFLFYVFFEAMLIPMYFLIGSYGPPGEQAQRSYAAVKFLLYSLFGGLLMLAAVIGLFVVSAEHGQSGTFSFQALLGRPISNPAQYLLFLGFFIAFAIKAPLFPFHTWLPDAGAESPTGGAVMLVGVLDKVGTFGFIRYCLPLFPHAATVLAPYVLALAVVGILYGALLAMGQSDMKRLVSYTSVAHFGFIALGIFAFSSQGGAGAVLYMFNHGLSTGALFLIVGFMVARRRTRLIREYEGVGNVAPWLAGTFLVAGLSSLALPGLSTFVGEFLVLVGAFTRYRTYAVLATLGIILAALYILLMYQRTMQGPTSAPNRGLPDLSLRESFVIAPVLVLIVVFGVYPKPLLDVITPAVDRTMSEIHRSDPRPPLPQPEQGSRGAGAAGATAPVGGPR